MPAAISKLGKFPEHLQINENSLAYTRDVYFVFAPRKVGDAFSNENHGSGLESHSNFEKQH